MAEREIFSNIAPNDTGIFKLAKQMDTTNQDVVGEKCERNDAGELSLRMGERPASGGCSCGRSTNTSNDRSYSQSP